MDTKFTLTYYDFVSHLIPGAALLLTFRHFSNIGSGLSDIQLTLYITIFGYISGLFLHLLGLLLFKAFYLEDYEKNNVSYKIVAFFDKLVYHAPLLKTKVINKPIKAALHDVIEKKLHLNLKQNRLLLFTVADTYVASLPFPERDVLAAKEGIFRSLAVFTIIETVYLGYFIFPSHLIIVLILGTLFTELSRYAREYYRTLKNQQIYSLAWIKIKNEQ